jgi:hypothetical protein
MVIDYLIQELPKCQVNCMHKNCLANISLKSFADMRYLFWRHMPNRAYVARTNSAYLRGGPRSHLFWRKPVRISPRGRIGKRLAQANIRTVFVSVLMGLIFVRKHMRMRLVLPMIRGLSAKFGKME